MALTLTTPPLEEPVTLAEAKDYLRVDTSADDALITALIVGARLSCEAATGRALLTQGWTLWLDAWPGTAEGAWWDGVREGAALARPARHVAMPKAPLQSVTQVATWSDVGAASVFAAENYLVDTASTPGRLVLRQGASWPQPTRAANGIEIRFTAGYGATAAEVPTALRQGLLAHIVRLYDRRGDEDAAALPPTALALYRPYVLPRL